MSVDLLPRDLREHIKSQVGYREERPKVCENCRYFITEPSGVYEGGNDHYCGIIKEIGCFPVLPGGTCSKFSRNPAP